MTRCTGGVDCCNSVAGMADDTRGGGGDCRGMAMLVLSKVQGVAFAAGMAAMEDIGRMGSVDRILQ